MAILSYQALCEKFKTRFSQDYNRDKEIHPIFSIILNSLNYLNGLFIIRYISILIFGAIPILIITTPLPKQDKKTVLVFVCIYWLVYILFIRYVIRVPYLNSLYSRKDNVHLVREKLKIFDFSYEDTVILVHPADA